MSGRAVARWAAILVGLLLGLYVAILVAFRVLAVDSQCAGYNDDGPMAAPGSPYSAVLCGTQGPGWEWILLLVPLVPLAAIVLLRRRSTALLLAIGLVVPTLVVGLLHVALPRDCSSGRTETGECSRDQESR